ncbi:MULTISPECIES: nucleoside-diphosphate kinase [Carboxydocella]|uniref:Nucleoside diphosphate kinase n=2 Tax=Carboxydocella TaxID=178898 RepID=A0A1T4RLA4_9FIRM|nr:MULTISPECIES: nucleoside-diphosphate kinase [Carboxydocella]AVX19303.1 nucleoside diphosphate kinase [Carboxydocella thermautotrophica]AVX29717.1 nucleoside diphosphate kinase [Carboxydocella thermautotrophica]GAW30372.1 nucleoside diphosphate kinase [Carboxydocella sp. JDF658]SKA16461.1 nucleoside diphosphate kinase [Carboxydocella sporoproducens DSM 16521]
MERTFVMIKPDGVQRNLVGEILARYEKKGYKLLAMKLMRVTEELAHQHYAEHVGKPFFPGLVEYITSGPVVALVLGGKGVVAGVRAMNGATNPANAAPGTIRGDYGIEVGRNVVHASDSVESAEREIAIYFKEEEILAYEKNVDAWLYE